MKNCPSYKNYTVTTLTRLIRSHAWWNVHKFTRNLSITKKWNPCELLGILPYISTDPINEKRTRGNPAISLFILTKRGAGSLFFFFFIPTFNFIFID
jgi:hypothetical protein